MYSDSTRLPRLFLCPVDAIPSPPARSLSRLSTLELCPPASQNRVVDQLHSTLALSMFWLLTTHCFAALASTSVGLDSNGGDPCIPNAHHDSRLDSHRIACQTEDASMSFRRSAPLSAGLSIWNGRRTKAQWARRDLITMQPRLSRSPGVALSICRPGPRLRTPKVSRPVHSLSWNITASMVAVYAPEHEHVSRASIADIDAPTAPAVPSLSAHPRHSADDLNSVDLAAQTD
ncbi:hypothetical protein C8Q80DRAFT_586239 [Daedaleopsis nitida]|nr:hypothetical protein C8Q80DRAFT_585923 [Daedaleopsis nitida]KAI0751599.1 hypothetical protein C8Q80DRAFT_586239 [Daedaleopsis nitida]